MLGIISNIYGWSSPEKWAAADFSGGKLSIGAESLKEKPGYGFRK